MPMLKSEKSKKKLAITETKNKELKASFLSLKSTSLIFLTMIVGIAM